MRIHCLGTLLREWFPRSNCTFKTSKLCSKKARQRLTKHIHLRHPRESSKADSAQEVVTNDVRKEVDEKPGIAVGVNYMPNTEDIVPLVSDQLKGQAAKELWSNN